MDLVEGERILWQGRPSWRAQLSFFVVWIPIALAPLIISAILAANDMETGLPVWQWVLISILLVVIVVVWDTLRRYATFYAVTNQRLRVRRGILARREQTARFDRVQNVDVSQSLMDRLLDVGTVDFDTAGWGEDSSSFRFEGIADPQALVHIVASNSRPAGAQPTAGL